MMRRQLNWPPVLTRRIERPYLKLRKTVMAIFHRECNTSTQTLQTLILQVHSGEIWGKPKFQGQGLLSVAAFPNALPHGVDGIEFDTNVPWDSPGTPKAVWSLSICPAVHQFVGPGGIVMCKMQVMFTRVVCMQQGHLLQGISCSLP
jgi:hypothetical protein